MSFFIFYSGAVIVCICWFSLILLSLTRGVYVRDIFKYVIFLQKRSNVFSLCFFQENAINALEPAIIVAYLSLKTFPVLDISAIDTNDDKCY